MGTSMTHGYYLTEKHIKAVKKLAEREQRSESFIVRRLIQDAAAGAGVWGEGEGGSNTPPTDKGGDDGR